MDSNSIQSTQKKPAFKILQTAQKRREKEKVIFIVDLTNIESVVACEYAFHTLQNKLKYIVIDREITTEIEQKHREKLQNLILKSSVINGSYEINTEIIDYIPLEDKNIQYIICATTKFDKLVDSIKENKYNSLEIKELAIATETPKHDKVITKTNKRFIINSNREDVIYVSDTESAINLLNTYTDCIKDLTVYTNKIVQHSENTSKGDLWQDDKLIKALVKKYELPEDTKLIYSLMTKFIIIKPILPKSEKRNINIFTQIVHELLVVNNETNRGTYADCSSYYSALRVSDEIQIEYEDKTYYYK